jgi:hypothetical protein
MSAFFHVHNLAKKLNNSAALCIERGHYERGIAYLVEALQLSDDRPWMTSHKTSACQCRHCSLDECVVYSERTCLQQNNCCSNDHNNQSEVLDCGYVHRRPIRITPQSVREGHNMGVTLPLIITFNLALAHHLSKLAAYAMSSVDDKHRTKMELDNNSNICNSDFQKIVQLYEVVYRWQITLEEDRFQKEQQQQDSSHVPFDTSPVNSLRFHMIILNNLSQIHLLAQNNVMHQRCLEHLLGTMMFVVATIGNNSSSEPRREQERYMDFDGFLLNASPLILQGQAAAAA